MSGLEQQTEREQETETRREEERETGPDHLVDVPEAVRSEPDPDLTDVDTDYLDGVEAEQEELTPAERATEGLDLALAGVDPDDKEATHESVLDAASTYREQMETLAPEERAAFIAESQDQLGELFRNSSEMSYDDLGTVMADLSQAAELAGPDAVDQLAAVLGDEFAGVVEARQEAGMGLGAAPIAGVLEDAMVNGNGGLLTAALARNLAERDDDTQYYAADLTTAQSNAMSTVTERQAESNEQAAELEGLFGNWVQNNYQLYGPEAIAEAEQAFRAEHADLYDEVNANNEGIASLLQGAAYTQEHSDVLFERTAFGHSEYLDDSSRDVLAASTTLGTGYEQGDDGEWRQSSLQEQVFADALLRSGDGETSWLDQAHELAEDGELGENMDAQLSSAEEQAALSMSQVLTVGGNFDDVGTMFQGLAQHNPAFGPVADELEGRLAEIQEQAESGEIGWDEASEQLGAAFAESAEVSELPDDVYNRVVAMGVGVEGAMRYSASLGREQGSLEQFLDGSAGFAGIAGDTDKYGGPGLGRLGPVSSGLGLAAGINDFIQGDANFQTAISATWGGAQFADDLVTTLTRSGGSQLIKRIGLPVGLALSGIDVASKIANGASAEEIAVASLPLAGAGIGAAMGAWFFGVGAVPGAAAGAAIGGAIQFIGGLFGLGAGDPTEGYENDSSVLTRAAMEHVLGPDASEEAIEVMSEQFSKVDDDFVGAGPMAALVADQMDMHPHDFLRQLSEYAGGEDGERVIEALVEDNLLEADITNWDEITDARDRAADGEEGVEIPEMEFADLDVEAIAGMMDQGFERDSFLWERTSGGGRNQRTTEYTPELYNTYGRRQKEDGYVGRHVRTRQWVEADPYNEVSASDLDTW